MTILGKKQMSEEYIKLNYITPVILSGWKGHEPFREYLQSDNPLPRKYEAEHLW